MPANYLEKEKIEEDFGFLSHVDSNKKLYYELLAQKGESLEAQVGLTPMVSYSLWRYELEDENFMVVMRCDETRHIIYYIKCKVWEDICLSNKPVTQVLLWRSRDVIYKNATRDITSAVFFRYLLPRYNLIASDSYQTVFGRYFWETKMTEALYLGHKVYRYDRITGEAIEIKDKIKVLDNTCDLWGDDDEYANVLALIGDI